MRRSQARRWRPKSKSCAAAKAIVSALRTPQFTAGLEVLFGQSCSHRGNEAVGPTVMGRAGEVAQLLISGAFEQRLGGPALEHAQDRRCPEVIAGDAQRDGIDHEHIGAEPVEQAPFVTGRPLVVTGDGTQFGRHLAVGGEGPQTLVTVEGEPTADPGVLGVVLLRTLGCGAGTRGSG